ncbi:MAG TPA: CHAP domain-containing protein [Chthoniobacter sp.]|jgi:hypothetical protein
MNEATPESTVTPLIPRRSELARIARLEGERRACGDSNRAGPEIECYLGVFREALNANAETERYADVQFGYDWCCAFVYYCCRQAGFRFPPKPEPGYRHTLAAVPAWHHWAVTGGFFHAVDGTVPEVGDIALFNRVFDGQPLDHIGIVVEVSAEFVVCAEGNVENRSGLFERRSSSVEGFVRLPESGG